MNREVKTKTVKMWEKCRVITASSWFAVTSCTILTAGGAFLMYAFENRGGTGEPFAWFDGASAWPSIAIILFATLLSIYFIIKANFDLWRNADELTEEFRLESPDEANRKSTSFFGWEAPPSKYVILRGSNTDQVQHTRPEDSGKPHLLAPITGSEIRRATLLCDGKPYSTTYHDSRQTIGAFSLSRFARYGMSDDCPNHYILVSQGGDGSQVPGEETGSMSLGLGVFYVLPPPKLPPKLSIQLFRGQDARSRFRYLPG